MNKNNLVEISSKQKSILAYLIEMFSNKYLILQISKKELITAYAQSLLGIFYHALVPMVQAIVFNFFFKKIEYTPSNEIPSFLFILISITIWNLFVNNSIKTSNIFLANRKYISKLYFNRFVFVISSCVINSIHFLINLSILFFVIFFFQSYYEIESVSLNFKIFMIPFLIFNVIILSSGIGMIISSLSIRYRDFLFGLTFIFQILMFISPVLFSLNTIHSALSIIFLINPVTSFLELFRWIFIDTYNLNLFFILINILTAFLIFFIGLKLYINADRKVADFI